MNTFLKEKRTKGLVGLVVQIPPAAPFISMHPNNIIYLYLFSATSSLRFFTDFLYILYYSIMLLRQKGNFPQHFGICEISHKSYISREFSYQYMGKFQRKFNLYARMKLLLNNHTWESHFSFATVQWIFPHILEKFSTHITVRNFSSAMQTVYVDFSTHVLQRCL